MSMLRTNNTPSHYNPRQSGTVYILVLSVTAMLVAIGVTAVMAGRVQVQAASLNEDQTQARVMAQTSIEFIRKSLNDDPGWRTNHTHDTWSSPIRLGAGTIRVKLVDEGDGSIADDANDPVRLYIKATVGSAVRIYSAVLVVTDTGLTVNGTTLRRELAD